MQAGLMRRTTATARPVGRLQVPGQVLCGTPAGRHRAGQRLPPAVEGEVDGAEPLEPRRPCNIEVLDGNA